MKTEFNFTLPRGYVDSKGDLHRQGTMRLATAADEILPRKDPRVQQNEGYLSIILFSRVVTRLGTLPYVDTRVIENLFAADMLFLKDMYQRINMLDIPGYRITCPSCKHEFEVPLESLLA